MAKKIVETPMMKQYLEMKRKHPDAVLLFRSGDFYETFGDDAIIASEILGITLTKRANGQATSVELAGFPHHALDTYLPKLVRAGKRVAIAEQLEDPKLTKKLVKRGITELVTPGVVLGDSVLDHRENNFLASVYHQKERWGLALLDISTGEFMVAEGSTDYIDKLLGSFSPKEVLTERGSRALVEGSFQMKYLTSELDDWVFTTDSAHDRLLKQFETTGLKGFGIDGMPLAIIAAGAVLHYLDVTHHDRLSHISRISRIEEDHSVRLDKFTVRNLELVATGTEDGKSLLDVLDHTAGPMGSRMIRRWILFPLRDTASINRRLDAVGYLVKHRREREKVVTHLHEVGDLERLVGKVASARVSPREMRQIALALKAIEPLRGICSGASDESLRTLGEQLNPCPVLSEKILNTLVNDPPLAVNRGTVIRDGVDAELDELRSISSSGKEYLAMIQKRESERTGITSLKIGFNNVFGYYIEVTNAHKEKVPEEWIRKQTLVNAERYITPELKTYEEKILGAQERIEIIEERLYNILVGEAAQYIPAMQSNAMLLGRLDCLQSFAEAAECNRYSRPTVDESLVIDIREGRHPVIERQLPAGEPYIANSVKLDNDGEQVMMITGPNMSGKSALLRQTALIALMAQAGSFVPADSARIGIVDKIFTRVGASDNLSVGESTFMVEMNEAAAILNNMSERSLILFDELGRGTSTYDGISIAWAIVEYIHENRRCHPKTLFATHYHELNEMAGMYGRVANYNVSVQEIDGKVVFMRKLTKGGSAHSFGIHVAKLAGMPKEILERADEILKKLESERRAGEISPSVSRGLAEAEKEAGGMQLSFFQLDDPVLSQVRDQILGLDINNLTPVAALNKLNEIKAKITGK
ncbi:MAG: DNA mismatch repair protein MutS [Muribaculaceae bacterium]|nr:DNA mismatch repair protein MutS [Muribaculaceae bacterium]